MSDDDRLLASITAQEAGQNVERCQCGSSANLCRMARYLYSYSFVCCSVCSH